MVNLQLKRSGGMLGKTLEATQQVDIAETELVKKLQLLKPVDNPLARDDFYHSITINGKNEYPIDMGKLKGALKKLISQMEDNLKAG